MSKLSEDYGRRTKWHDPEEYNIPKIIAERDKYKAQRDELLATVKGIFGLLDSGVLVRDTSHDADPKWYLKALELTSVLAKAKAAMEIKL